MAKKKVPRRVHNRRPKPKIDDETVIARRNQEVVRFDAAFCNDLPQNEHSGQHARSGSYVQVERDRFDGKEFDIADGKYRVEGSDWIFTFEGGGFVEAEKAEPPAYGGKGVISVPRPVVTTDPRK